MAGRRWLDAVLGLGREWKVTRVEPTRKPKELRVELERTGGSRLKCPHLRRGVPGLRYSAARVAEPGRLGLQDLSGLQRPAGPVPGARGGDDPGALGGGAVEVHGGVRGGGDPVAQGGEHTGGRQADAAELERGGRNHATCGGAWTCAPQDGSGPAPFGGRDLVPPPAQVRDRGVDSGDRPRPACRPGEGQGCAHGVLRGLGREVPGGRRERQHGHVGPTSRRPWR